MKKEKEKKDTIGVSNLKWNAANGRKGKGVRTRTTSTKENVVPHKMLKNQGLKAHKKRVDRNPRVKKRRQYEKAKKNRKGAVREMRSEQGSYKGETTGIRTTISRSRRLG